MPKKKPNTAWFECEPSPTLFGRAMMVLKALNLSVTYELAPEVKKEIAEICSEFESEAQPQDELHADTLFGIYCNGTPESIPKDRPVFWHGWQRLADWLNKRTGAQPPQSTGWGWELGWKAGIEAAAFLAEQGEWLLAPEQAEMSDLLGKLTVAIRALPAPPSEGVKDNRLNSPRSAGPGGIYDE